jgi:hypothetical protein
MTWAFMPVGRPRSFLEESRVKRGGGDALLFGQVHKIVALADELIHPGLVDLHHIGSGSRSQFDLFLFKIPFGARVFGLDRDIGIQFHILVDGLDGRLMTGFAAPPGKSQGHALPLRRQVARQYHGQQTQAADQNDSKFSHTSSFIALSFAGAQGNYISSNMKSQPEWEKNKGFYAKDGQRER